MMTDYWPYHTKEKERIAELSIQGIPKRMEVQAYTCLSSTSSILKLIIIILLSMFPDWMDSWYAIGKLSLFPQWIPIVSASEGHSTRK